MLTPPDAQLAVPIPARTHADPEPVTARMTPAHVYRAYRDNQARTPSGLRIKSATMPSPVPLGIRLVPDLDGVHFWTDPYGAAILAGVSRRTIYTWKTKGWLTIRYMASAKLEIRVDSLWWRAEEREAATATIPADPDPRAGDVDASECFDDPDTD